MDQDALRQTLYCPNCPLSSVLYLLSSQGYKPMVLDPFAQLPGNFLSDHSHIPYQDTNQEARVFHYRNGRLSIHIRTVQVLWLEPFLLVGVHGYKPESVSFISYFWQPRSFSRLHGNDPSLGPWPFLARFRAGQEVFSHIFGLLTSYCPDFVFKQGQLVCFNHRPCPHGRIPAF